MTAFLNKWDLGSNEGVSELDGTMSPWFKGLAAALGVMPLRLKRLGQEPHHAPLADESLGLVCRRLPARGCQNIVSSWAGMVLGLFAAFRLDDHAR